MNNQFRRFAKETQIHPFAEAVDLTHIHNHGFCRDVKLSLHRTTRLEQAELKTTRERRPLIASPKNDTEQRQQEKPSLSWS